MPSAPTADEDEDSTHAVFSLGLPVVGTAILF